MIRRIGFPRYSNEELVRMHSLDFTKEIHVYVWACTEGFKIELTSVNIKYKAKNEISRIMILTISSLTFLS
jgi:hypothetical protein